MSRHINHLFNITKCVLRLKRSRTEVRYPRINAVTNRNLSCTNFIRQQTENALNNSFNNDPASSEAIIHAETLNDEEYEWSDVPADKVKSPHALDICTEDVSHIARHLRPTFNFAAYADESETIQELIKLGVELYKLDKNPLAMKCLLGRSFEDMKPYIQFLHDCGVPADHIGRSLTKNPLIFNNDMDDLHTRIRYLRAHNFSRHQISEIITKNPLWLNYKTTTIDSRLAFFQREFKITGHQTRSLAVTEPQLITRQPMLIWENTLAIREEMGFELDQVRKILLTEPCLWMRVRQASVAVFDYVHNVMKIPHEHIARMPRILMTRIEIVKNRHEFLKLLGRVQYDPTKPLYISLDNIVKLNDFEFCAKIAQASIELYDMFLKTR